MDPEKEGITVVVELLCSSGNRIFDKNSFKKVPDNEKHGTRGF